MHVKSMQLCWISVKNLSQAIKYYTEVVGLKLMVSNEEFGWAELQGADGGARVGLAESNEGRDIVKPGQNAVLTFTVDDLEKTKGEMLKKGAHLIGNLEEVPGHVKLQLFKDQDGNHFQVVQML